MNTTLAGLLLYAVTACLGSGLLFLPCAALAEWIPRRRPSGEAYAWFAALALPHLGAAACAIYAVRLHALDPVPWETRAHALRHLSFWWIANAPDAAYRARFVALVAAGVVLVGLLRPLLSAGLSWRYARLLARSSTEIPELGVWLTPLDRPWSTCVGFFRSRVYLTRGLAELLDPDELSAVIAHEHAHARRRDNLRLLLAQAIFGPTIILPTAHYFHRRLQGGLERAADREAVRRGTDGQGLAAALVKAARKLREFSGDAEDEPLRRRLADRYREEFVAERARLLLDAAGEASEPSPLSRRVTMLVPAVLMVVLTAIGAGLVAPTVRSFFESVLAALQGAH